MSTNNTSLISQQFLLPNGFHIKCDKPSLMLTISVNNISKDLLNNIFNENSRVLIEIEKNEFINFYYCDKKD